MAKFLYRINGGEVLSISTEADPWPNIDTTYYGVIDNPPTPDGQDLGIPKIYSATEIRNATPLEINNFPSAQAVDENLVHRGNAGAAFDLSNANAKLSKAIVLALLDEINLLRAQHSLPARTRAQARIAIMNKLNSGEAD